MNMNFKCKLPIPAEVKSEYPVSEELGKVIAERNEKIAEIIRGDNDRLLLIIGPCSADNEDSVIDYICRLREVQEKVNDKILFPVSTQTSPVPQARATRVCFISLTPARSPICTRVSLP